MQPIYLNESGFRVLARLQAKATELGASPYLLALAWAMKSPGVTSVLIGARDPAQVDQALAADALPLPDSARAELGAL
jgi:aryl-alcohol dehydrogenase-like predicted oxidoreductase